MNIRDLIYNLINSIKERNDFQKPEFDVNKPKKKVNFKILLLIPVIMIAVSAICLVNIQ